MWSGSKYAVLLLRVLLALPLQSAEPSSEDLQFFETKIRPVLVSKCYSCHSPKAEKIKGEFLLDTRAGIRKGGTSGRDAVIPGDIEGSQLIEAIRYQNEKLQMPPEDRLADSVIADFEKWVGMGAPDPRDGISRLPREINAEHHWAWKPPVRRRVPSVQNGDWPRGGLDHFVLSRLEAEGMRPNPDAERRTLIRRVSLELIGLPPSVSDIRAFLDDPAETHTAFAKVVDRLLADTGFGVRWGRHWLDIARYGESSGYSRNMLFPHAWRYRNYVIDSFNADKPIDRFIREQIAGDLLPGETYRQREDQTIGTGFLTVGAKTFNEGNLLLFNLNCADDQIDVTCRAFLALTVNCARCHDHKYDPIPTRDYYAMAGVFLSSRNLAGSETNVRNEHSEALPLGPDGWSILDKIAAAEKNAVEVQSQYMALVKIRNTLRDPLIKQGIDWKKKPTPELAKAEAEVQAFQAKVKLAKNSIPQHPEYAMAVVEGLDSAAGEKFDEFVKTEKAEIAAMKKAGKRAKNPTPVPPKIKDSPLFEKGLHDSPLETVPRGALSVFGYQTPAIGTNESGRLQLANWIVDSRNPLTARVFVNRVWHHLFGRGLVETVDNFGALGMAPSHPELLDTLALDFMNDGWSVKNLIRRIVLSRTWCQSSRHVVAYSNKDPDARLMWRFSPQLLEGEAIRDGVLSVTGSLDLVHLNTSQVAEISKQQALGRQREIGRRDYYMKDVNWDVRHRSVYLPMTRGVIPDVLATFDAADPNLVVGARKLTIVPTQALYLANSKLVVEESIRVAKRILDGPEQGRMEMVYEMILGRLPRPDEAGVVRQFLQQSEDKQKNWARVCQTLMCSGEFRTVY